VTPPSTPSDSEEARAFLQRRAGSYGLLVGLLGLGFWTVRAAGQIAQGDPGHLLEGNMVLHFLGGAPLVALWGVLRARRWSARFVRWAAPFALVVSCLAYGGMCLDMTQAFRPDMTLLLIYSLASLTRAVYIPSTWRRTAGLSVALGAELALVTWFAFTPLNPDFAAAFEGQAFDVGGELRIQILSNVMLWWASLAVVASSASHVIYGLRRDLSRVRRLGQYTLVRKIGEGGMGQVFEARHAMLRRPTAVKLLHPDRVGEDGIARFEREVRATSELEHPNTITVYDFGRTPDGVFYYAMKYVDGATLTDVVELAGPLPPARVVYLLEQIAGALAEAHEAGLVHRDVKPDNVLLTQSGWKPDHVKVVDFGLVKDVQDGRADVTADNHIVGTPRYLAPEVIRGAAEPDPRSDLYALGCVAYFLLTGEHVFDGATVVEIASLHLTEAPEPPSVRGAEPSPQLEALVMRCLEKDPQARPQSAEALRRALEATPEHDGWSRDEAARWWRDFAPELKAPREDGSIGTADTRALSIDLGDRD